MQWELRTDQYPGEAATLWLVEEPIRCLGIHLIIFLLFYIGLITIIVVSYDHWNGSFH